MDAEFWQQRWALKQTAFHAAEVHAMLTAHHGQLALPEASRVFVPLCGKTHDIDWLASRGHAVVGSELNRPAVEEVFDRMGKVPVASQEGELTRLAAGDVEIFVGDHFQLTAEQLGPVDAIYDRAALVALPDAMRRVYAGHLMVLTQAAPQLLIIFDYDQDMMDGPPFSVPESEIQSLYGDVYKKTLLSRRTIGGPLAGRCSGNEEAWLLTRQ